ncbi:MAG TPA: deoxyribodipyrimidine photo-lyase [Candidatus Saccharimonadales bacterium]|nr:deoxyribodipyrimidine photo-lyase [Candidatus Saccharimonadales bacterium]
MEKRTVLLHRSETSGTCVVYVMSRDQRVADNHALYAAQKHALAEKLPLVVVFNLRQNVGYRAYEHFAFMLEGLSQVAERLASLHIPFVWTAESSAHTLEATLTRLKPAALYWDFSPLHGARQRAKLVATTLGVTSYVVDTHNIIPVWHASDHQEFAAHTFRSKVHANLAAYLQEPDAIVPHPYSLKALPTTFTTEEAWEYIAHQPKRGITISFTSGEAAATKLLDDFIAQKLPQYALKRNDIAEDFQSNLSPYLHFGQLASLRVALDVLAETQKTPLLFERAKMASAGDQPSAEDGMNALFEEMIVRKELSDNFCFYAKSFTSFDAIPAWAVDTLTQHQTDRREHVYTIDELRSASTHDPAWNAAQRELTTSGKMHGYMRMYWAKKLLEWTPTPQDALAIAIELNDSYSIDGGDPNGYVGMLWSIAGLHDRPWTERPIFGKIRYMNLAGLERKFNLNAYISRIAAR